MMTRTQPCFCHTDDFPMTSSFPGWNKQPHNHSIKLPDGHSGQIRFYVIPHFPEVYHGQEVSEARFLLLRAGSRGRGGTQHLASRQLGTPLHLVLPGRCAPAGLSRSGTWGNARTNRIEPEGGGAEKERKRYVNSDLVHPCNPSVST